MFLRRVLFVLFVRICGFVYDACFDFVFMCHATAACLSLCCVASVCLFSFVYVFYVAQSFFCSLSRADKRMAQALAFIVCNLW